MKRFPHLIHVFALFFGGTAFSFWVVPEQAFAQGCCFGAQRAPAYPVGAPVPITPTAPAGTAMNSYYGNYGMLPPSPGTVFPAGLPQSSAAFLPTAAYDTRWMQTPVTYYRPVTQFDPNYGTTVTSLQPCTSYQYQAARVPLVSPRTISDYSYSANRWPVAATPGYYPNNVVPAGTLPGAAAYPTLQQLPAVGSPVTSNMMSYASNGTSTGPASTLPLATMSPSAGGVVTANHMAPMGSTPYAATQATAWMPATTAPIAQVPITSAIPGTGTPIYTVPATAPTSFLTPCPNGVCVPGSIPSVPGAASVVPLGAPTVMAPSALPSTSPSTSSASALPMAPNVTNPILPNPGDIKPLLPPSSGTDPEATRQPSLGSSAAMFPMKRVPISDIERSTSTVPTAQPSIQEESRARLTVPQTLPPSPASPNAGSPSSTIQPLKAPSEFDAKPRWNPKLLPRSSGETSETVASTWTGSCVTV